MNLFRKHKKFEEQLHEQLGDMEVKPSSSLWDRIDSNIANDSFENGVQDSLENFEQMPYPETWDKIAAELPEEKVGNRLMRYYVAAAFALLFATGIYVGKRFQDDNKLIAENTQLQELPLNQTEAALPKKLGTENNGEIDEQRKTQRESSSDNIIPQTSNTTLNDHSENNVRDQNNESLKSTSISPKNKNIQRSAVENEEEKSALKPVTVDNAQTINKETAASVLVNNTAPTIAATKDHDIKSTQKDIDGEEPGNNNTQSIQSAPILLSKAENTENLNDGLIVQNNNIIPADTSKRNASQTNVAAAASTNTLSQPREVIETKPDSAAYAQHVQTLNAKQDNDGLTRFSISIYAGAHLSYTTYNDPKQQTALNFDKNIELRKQLERPEIDWSGGFLLDYRLGKRWMVSSGIAMVNFSQKFEYNIEQALRPTNAAEISAPISNPNDSFVIGNQYSNRIKYSWTEIPVYVNYTIIKGKRWNVDMQAGASYAFINTVDGGMISYDNKGVLVLRGKESFPEIKNTIFLTAMPQVSYAFGSSVSLGLVPTIKYSVTSIIGNERWIQQHPYFIGMNICLRKRF
jgi:hypothetical protein